jgi:hypothetical protein
MKTELERYKEALEVAKRALHPNGCGMLIAHEAFRKIDSILNPPPEMETITIEQYTVIGTYQRPKPQKEEKSVSGEVKWVRSSGCTYPIGRDIDFDWADVLGKTGVLTFTWQE